MPGIAGMVSQSPAEECQGLVEAMVASMRHEDFYTSGTYFAPELKVYVGWIAHESSFAARQPFLNEESDIALIFSGECFSNPEISRSLRRKRHEIRNRNDWLVHFYEEEGERCFEELNGLFSGLLIDRKEKKAFLFNDRYAVERIYWHETDDTIFFASEAKALLRILSRLRAFDNEGIAQFLNYGCTFGERTLFRDVQLLPGGSLWSFEDGKCHRRKYFSVETWESRPVLSTEDFMVEFRETFGRVLPPYFEPHSRIGISLTGGLDTRMIMACLPDTDIKPISYTFSGETGETLDDRLAAQIARESGLEHRLVRIGRDFFSNFGDCVDRTVYVTDGCFGATGAHEIYLNSQARLLAPVRLTGNYGSEILRGVSTLKPLGLSPSLFARQFGAEVSSGAGPVMNENDHPVTFAAFREVPCKLFGSLAAGRSKVGFRTPYLDNEIVALAYQAPQSLRTSPMPAWQVVRENKPSLGKIPTDRRPSPETSVTSQIFKRVFLEATFKLDYLNNEGWPHRLGPLEPVFRHAALRLGILGLHKYLGYRNWFKRELAGYLRDVMAQAHIRQSPFWNANFLERMVNEHTAGRKNYVHEINAVITLDTVERLILNDVAYNHRKFADSNAPVSILGDCSK